MDEDQERELWMAELQLASVRSLQAVGVLTQEQDMLAGMLKRQDEDVDSAQQEAEGARMYLTALVTVSHRKMS